MNHGLTVENIKLVVEYQAESCFKYFGERVSNARRIGDSDPSKTVLAETYKLLGNSAYGKTLTNIMKHRNIKYVRAEDVSKLVNDPRFNSMVELEDGMVEVNMNKQVAFWDLPLQIGFLVYQYTKLRMLEFHYDFLYKYVDRKDYQLLEMDTDSLYLAPSKETLEDVVRPNMRQQFADEWDDWFPAEA
ncbi:hypothetical protein ElyMa_000794400, partial [Elysia marginata]